MAGYRLNGLGYPFEKIRTFRSNGSGYLFEKEIVDRSSDDWGFLFKDKFQPSFYRKTIISSPATVFVAGDEIICKQ